MVGNYPGSLDILYSAYFEEEAKTGSIWHCPYPSQAMYTRGADGDSWGEFCAPSAPLLEESSGNRSPAAPLSRKVSALLARSLGHCVAEGRPSLHHFRSFITGLNMLWFRARDRSFHTSSFPPCRCYPTPPPFLFYLLKVFLSSCSLSGTSFLSLPHEMTDTESHHCVRRGEVKRPVTAHPTPLHMSA